MLKPDRVFTVNGVTVKEKLIPEDAVWTDKEKAEEAGETVGAPYISDRKLSGNTGKIQGVTIHNTEDLENVEDDAEQYTRATWPNQNIKGVRVHYYVDENGAWQNLPLDKVGYHAGDTDNPNGGNNTTVALEVIMSGKPEDSVNDEKAEDNAARLAAQILYDNGLGIKQLYTHTYWINEEEGTVFDDKDVQKVYIKDKVYKVCPIYILPHWAAFAQKVQFYIDELEKKKP